MSLSCDMDWQQLNKEQPGEHFVNSVDSYRQMEEALSELYQNLLYISIFKNTDETVAKDLPSSPLSPVY